MVKNKKSGLKDIREKREELRQQWSLLNDVQRKIDFEKAVDIRKEERETFKKWSFYDGIIKALDK